MLRLRVCQNIRPERQRVQKQEELEIRIMQAGLVWVAKAPWAARAAAGNNSPRLLGPPMVLGDWVGLVSWGSGSLHCTRDSVACWLLMLLFSCSSSCYIACHFFLCFCCRCVWCDQGLKDTHRACVRPHSRILDWSRQWFSTLAAHRNHGCGKLRKGTETWASLQRLWLRRVPAFSAPVIVGDNRNNSVDCVRW